MACPRSAPPGKWRRSAVIGKHRACVRRWPQAYCAYAIDHAAFLDELRRRERRLPGLFLTGDFVRGASLEACTRAGVECADHVAASGIEGSGEAAFFDGRGGLPETAAAIRR